MSRLRVLFFGNHTVGVESLRTLLDYVEVVGVVAHPPDPEDGVRYESVFEYARSQGLSTIRGKAKSAEVRDFARTAESNLFWVTDYRYLLTEFLLSLPNLGAVNLHPSLLPKYRGRAPINWAILNGETELGLTAHFIDAGVDDGDIILQRAFHLGGNEDVGDALRRLLPLYREVTRDVVTAFTSNGSVTRTPQQEIGMNIFRARGPEDGEIDWTKPAVDVLNLIRAVARPYPGAFTMLHNKKVIIWKAVIKSDNGEYESAGTIVKFEDGYPIVACGTGAIAIRELSKGAKLCLGDCFGGIHEK